MVYVYRSLNSLVFTSLAISVIYFLLSPAMANVAGVGNAKVDKGILQTQVRVSYTEDDESVSADHQIRTRLMADYGLTDDFALGLYLNGDHRNGEGQEFDSAMLDARFELTDATTHGYYSGIRLRYTFKDGDSKPDNAHIRFIFGVPVGEWDFRINQIIAHETGQDARGGLGMETRLQASYTYMPGHRAGLESFSDFGYGSRQTTFSEQNHSIGPVFAGAFADGLGYEAGYRTGVSDAAADHTFKFFLIRKF